MFFVFVFGCSTGRYTVVLTATNTRSILIKRIEVNVESKLLDTPFCSSLDVSYHIHLEKCVASFILFPVENTNFLWLLCHKINVV